MLFLYSGPLCEKYEQFKKDLSESLVVERDVEEILDMIQQRIDDVEFMKDNSALSASSMALQWRECQPDYEARLKKIRMQVSPEQKARIDAAEKRLAKVLDELVWQ